MTKTEQQYTLAASSIGPFSFSPWSFDKCDSFSGTLEDCIEVASEMKLNSEVDVSNNEKLRFFAAVPHDSHGCASLGDNYPRIDITSKL